nr:immunoglobulin light chain junction region [Macaca mulatta]MOW64828.1 immunoglobulin light chain junction region [Macaca mulatta]MOW66003.1 immunoglobulin light chain junction region [Macaca mulatta]
CLQDIEFPLTF